MSVGAPGKGASRRRRTGGEDDAFTPEERAAMRERARELRAARRPRSPEEAEREVLARIAEMPEPDRGMGERLHAIVRSVAPDLVPRLWYGMPAYAKDGKVLCFFQPASKFGTRYATFGFTDQARLDQGAMWPVSFALTELTAAEERKITTLVRRAVR
ncbi:hypothetical protein HRbin12_00225 [bacterium HR12]|nr:hypothetical protein HRbin12_00225 [bacterium HR12]